jgi:hypothetical protein
MRAIRKELDEMESERHRLTAKLTALTHRIGEELETPYEFSPIVAKASGSDGETTGS